MFARLRLERFRGFQAFETSLGAVTALVGANASGKTTLLQAIRIVSDAFAVAMESPDYTPTAESTRVRVCSQEVIAEPSRLLALKEWRELFADADAVAGTTLTIELDTVAGHPFTSIRLDLHYGRNSQLKMSLTMASGDAAALSKIGKKVRTEKIREWIDRHRPVVLFAPAFYGVVAQEEYRTLPVVRRLVSSGDQAHVVRNLVARLDQAALQRLNTFLLPTIGARITEATPQSRAELSTSLVVRYQDHNGQLEISSGAAGLVSLVSLFAALEGLRPERHADRLVVVLLDEPEAHLHPKLQGEVGLALAGIAQEFGAQLIMATHSVELINRLGGRAATALVHVDRRRTAGVELLSQSDVIDALDAFCDLTPFTALNFLASRRVLFHEGKSDFSYLNACANIMFRSDPSRLARWKAYLAIGLDGVGNVSAQGVLAKLLNPGVFPRLGDAERTRVALVLDSDADREAKLEWSKKLPENLEGIECVWPRYSIESLFLEPAVLAGWIEPLFPGRSVIEVVRAVCAHVDQDQDLNDAAEDARAKVLRRASSDHKALTDAAAHKQARIDVRGDPARFQHGRNRAKKVLAELSKRLGPGLRGDLEAIVSAGDPNVLDAARVIPDAVRALLDRLVGDAAPTLTS